MENKFDANLKRIAHTHPAKSGQMHHEKPHMVVYLADIEWLLGVRGNNGTHLRHREQRLLDTALSLWQRRQEKRNKYHKN